MAGHDLQLVGNLPLLRLGEHPVGHPAGHVGAHADGGTSANGEGLVRRAVGGFAVGHVHRHAEVGLNRPGAYRGARPGDLLPCGAQEIEVYVQLPVPQQLRRPQQGDEAGAVVHGLAAHLILSQGKAAAPIDHGRPHRYGPLRLRLGQAHVHEQLGQGYALVRFPPSRTGHDAPPGRVGQHHQLPAGQHPGIHAADAAEAQEAVLHASDQQADLIQMGVQQEPGRSLLPASAHPQHIAHAVHGHLVHQRPEQLRRYRCRRGFKAGGRGAGAQPLQGLSHIQIGFTPFHGYRSRAPEAVSSGVRSLTPGRR